MTFRSPATHRIYRWLADDTLSFLYDSFLSGHRSLSTNARRLLQRFSSLVAYWEQGRNSNHTSARPCAALKPCGTSRLRVGMKSSSMLKSKAEWR